MTRVRHYTNRNGLVGIENDGKILALDNNRIYLEPASSKPLSPKEAEIKHQIKKDRGRDHVETDVLDSQLEWIPNPRYGTPELTAKGDLPVENATFTKRR